MPLITACNLPAEAEQQSKFAEFLTKFAITAFERTLLTNDFGTGKPVARQNNGHRCGIQFPEQNRTNSK